MEEMIRYLAETQRIMAENIVKLTEVQQTQQQQITEMSQRQVELSQQQIELSQHKAETDQRFNVLLEEIRYLIRKLDGQAEP